MKFLITTKILCVSENVYIKVQADEFIRTLYARVFRTLRLIKNTTQFSLENDYILVMILPEIGGKIQRLYDKTNGYDAAYYNEVVKPALVGLAGPWILEVLI